MDQSSISPAVVLVLLALGGSLLRQERPSVPALAWNEPVLAAQGEPAVRQLRGVRGIGNKLGVRILEARWRVPLGQRDHVDVPGLGPVRRAALESVFPPDDPPAPLAPSTHAGTLAPPRAP